MCRQGKMALVWVLLNTLRLRQNGCHFADDFFKCIFLNETIWISIWISNDIFSEIWLIGNNSPLAWVMAWCQIGNTNKCMLMHICTTRPNTRPHWIEFRSLIFLFGEYLLLQKHHLDSLNHIHISQVSQQLSCGETCKIWTWHMHITTLLMILKNGEYNRMEEIGLITLNPVKF